MLEWFISSAILLAVLIALHYLLRGRVSPKLQYALWAIALVRLLLPLSVGQSAASVENLVPETQHYVLYTAPRTAPEPEASAPSQPQQAAQPPVQVLPAREAAETQKAVIGRQRSGAENRPDRRLGRRRGGRAALVFWLQPCLWPCAAEGCDAVRPGLARAAGHLRLPGHCLAVPVRLPAPGHLSDARERGG